MLSAELRVASGKQKGKAIPLKIGKFMVGRGEDCHLRPNNELVSRHHCVFTVDEFVVRLRDLGSTNGTVVNGERIRGQVILNHGDKVGIGKLEFEVSLKGAMVTAGVPVGTILDTDSSSGNIPLKATMAGQKAIEHPAESDTAMISPNKTVTMPVFVPAPEPEEMAQEEEVVAEIDEEQGTAYEMPVAQPQQMMPPGPAYGGFGQMMPGMPYGAPQPMYPQMPMGYGGYPNYPAMPPMMYPQYPQQGYAPMPQPPYGMPQQMQPAPAAVEEEEPAVVERKAPQVKLPDPKDTGAKPVAPPEKKPAAAGGGPAPTDPRRAATDILKQMSQRRPV